MEDAGVECRHSINAFRVPRVKNDKTREENLISSSARSILIHDETEIRIIFLKVRHGWSKL